MIKLLIKVVFNRTDITEQCSYIYVTCYLVSSQQSDGSWIPPSSWTGPSAVIYQNFDSSDGFGLMEGTQAASDSVPLVSGKVKYTRFFFQEKKY